MIERTEEEISACYRNIRLERHRTVEEVEEYEAGEIPGVRYQS